MEAKTNKLRLYSIYTKSHQILKEDWFLPTIPDEFDLRITQSSLPGGDYRTNQFKLAILEKADFIISAIQECLGKTFVYSDVDIQFFRPVRSVLEEAIKDNDIACQRDSPGIRGQLCTGFFIVKANQRTLRLWQLVRSGINKEGRDQRKFNRLLRTIQHIRLPFMELCPKINYSYLPENIYSAGTYEGKHWSPGMPLSIPNDIILHHANWTEGMNNKIAQLEYVKSLVMEKSESKSNL